MINNQEIICNAHFNIKKFKETFNYISPSFNSEYGWLKYLITNTPNGFILKENIIYNFANSKKIYLAHITKNFESIVRDKKILASSGCLVGSIYCVPVIKEKNKLRLHNLGKYIIEKEAPFFKKTKEKISLILIEVNSPLKIKVEIGINYLKLGLFHFFVFSALNYLLSNKELRELKLEVVYSIKKISKLFYIINNFNFEDIKKNFNKFYNLYKNNIQYVSILGYFLFEIICEYISLFQQGKIVDYHHSVNEIYCNNFKEIIYKTCPSLNKSFNLGFFQPDFPIIKKYLNEIKIVQKNNYLSFEDYFLRRITYFFNNYFYENKINSEEKKFFWKNIEWNFEYLQYFLKPLIGHIIHRFLRNLHRFPDLYFYFDQYKALQIWNYWNKNNVFLPYNAILPKGEIGINPANPYTKYNFFSTKIWKENNSIYILPDKKLSLEIKPRLVEIDMFFLRKK